MSLFFFLKKKKQKNFLRDLLLSIFWVGIVYLFMIRDIIYCEKIKFFIDCFEKGKGGEIMKIIEKKKRERLVIDKILITKFFNTQKKKKKKGLCHFVPVLLWITGQGTKKKPFFFAVTNISEKNFFIIN